MLARAYLDELRSRLPLSQLIGRDLRLQRRGSEHSACARSTPRRRHRSLSAMTGGFSTASAVARMVM